MTLRNFWILVKAAASSWVDDYAQSMGAASVFAELQDALDRIWRAPRRHKSGIWNLLRARLLSFGMIMGSVFY